jgi:hypothetical protein
MLCSYLLLSINYESWLVLAPPARLDTRRNLLIEGAIPSSTKLDRYLSGGLIAVSWYLQDHVLSD